MPGVIHLAAPAEADETVQPPPGPGTRVFCRHCGRENRDPGDPLASFSCGVCRQAELVRVAPDPVATDTKLRSEKSDGLAGGLLGGAAGAALGGPIGAAIGFAIGALFGYESARGTNRKRAREHRP